MHQAQRCWAATPAPSCRFEIPFNIWCGKCGEHIAKGERFNAEKKAIGNYHSTKVLQFTMTHHCGCKITIQTDPKNAEYIVVEGAQRKVGSCRGACCMQAPMHATSLHACGAVVGCRIARIATAPYALQTRRAW